MATCDVCGERLDPPRQCTECGGTFCSRHQLPESHGCAALADWGGSEFGTPGDPRARSTGKRDTAARSSPDGLLARLGARIEGNVTYVFLGLMALTFGAQYVGFPLAGHPPQAGGGLWRATFVFTTEHPEYVWTWFISMFAHGGLFHLLLNGVVIFFFGRLVEEYVGSTRYALLFLGSGLLAGFGQTGVLLLQSIDSGGLGASGAALAILGTVTGINPRLRVYLFFVLPIPIWLFTGGYFALTFRAIQAGGITQGGVGHGAHLVGLLVGLGYGLYVKGRGDGLPDHLQFGGGRQAR